MMVMYGYEDVDSNDEENNTERHIYNCKLGQCLSVQGTYFNTFQLISLFFLTASGEWLFESPPSGPDS